MRTMNACSPARWNGWARPTGRLLILRARNGYTKPSAVLRAVWSWIAVGEWLQPLRQRSGRTVLQTAALTRRRLWRVKRSAHCWVTPIMRDLSHLNLLTLFQQKEALRQWRAVLFYF